MIVGLNLKVIFYQLFFAKPPPHRFYNSVDFLELSRLRILSIKILILYTPL